MIAFCNAWVLATLAVFYYGPIDWPGARSPTVALYVGLCLLAFNAGTRVARNGVVQLKPLPIIPRTRTGSFAIVSVYSGISLLYVAAVTQKSLLSAGSYSLDYGQVYDQYQAAIGYVVLPAGIGLLLIAKACLFPIVLILIVRDFRTDRWLILVFLVPMVVSSLFRGTDLEIIDMAAIVFGITYLYGMLNWRRVVFGALLTVGVLELFLARRVSRYGGDLPACLPDSTACFDPDGFIARMFGPRAEELSVFLANYIANGYQGLAYAFQLPWHPNWGFGHLPTLGSTACQYVGGCPATNYQQQLTMMGWDSQNRWTTAYTVIANDFSFLIVPLYLFMLGVATRRLLNVWRLNRDAAAGAGLILVLAFWLYSSANMHLAITLDWAIATVALLYIVPWRFLSNRSVGVPNDTQRS